LQVAYTVGTNLCKAFSATATGLNSTAFTGYSNTTTVLSTSKTATKTVTAGTTKFTSTPAAGTGTGATPSTSTSSAAANGLVAGIGGAIGVLALVAAL